MIRLYDYKKCSTCRKAKKYLEDNNVEFEKTEMVENPPSKQELKQLVNIADLPLDKFFNTRGKKYKELNLKEKLLEMTDDEKYELLSSDGKLIKRPIVTDGTQVLLGFKESEYEAFIN